MTIDRLHFILDRGEVGEGGILFIYPKKECVDKEKKKKKRNSLSSSERRSCCIERHLIYSGGEGGGGRTHHTKGEGGKKAPRQRRGRGGGEVVFVIPKVGEGRLRGGGSTPSPRDIISAERGACSLFIKRGEYSVGGEGFFFFSPPAGVGEDMGWGGGAPSHFSSF